MARTRHARREQAEPDTDDERSESPGRGVWSGSISFGLLQIPISLYTAERPSEEVHFRLLDKHDLSPIRYERVNAATGKPVEWKDIVKGYEVEDERFVVLSQEDLKNANVKATQTIDIQDFVPADQIDPQYFERPYYVAPQKRATKAYVLLRKALEARKAVAVATFVMRTREHLCALMPVGDAIMLEILRFGHELKRAADMPIPNAKSDDDAVSERELAMAEQLIAGMMSDWKPSRYKDRYHDDVMKMIAEKAKTGTATARHARVRGEVASDVVDLLDLLKKSVAHKGKAANDASSTHKTTKGRGGPKKARGSRRKAA